MNLTKSSFLNFANNEDPLSAFLFHNEKRGFYQGKPVYVPTLDKNGKLTKELVKGPIAGHYVQAKDFDSNGYLNITNQRGSSSTLTESLSQLLCFGNKATGEPLGIAVDWLDKIKNN